MKTSQRETPFIIIRGGQRYPAGAEQVKPKPGKLVKFDRTAEIMLRMRTRHIAERNRAILKERAKAKQAE